MILQAVDLKMHHRLFSTLHLYCQDKLRNDSKNHFFEEAPFRKDWIAGNFVLTDFGS